MLRLLAILFWSEVAVLTIVFLAMPGLRLAFLDYLKGALS